MDLSKTNLYQIAMESRARGNNYYDSGQYAQALNYYEKSLDLLLSNKLQAELPIWCELYNNRGLANYHTNHIDEAISDFSEVIRMLPNVQDEAYYHRGLCYKAKRLYQRAIEDFTKAMKINPNDSMACNERGIAFAEIGQLTNAINDFENALRIDPNYGPARDNLNRARSL